MYVGIGSAIVAIVVNNNYSDIDRPSPISCPRNNWHYNTDNIDWGRMVDISDN
jgi:hypothetical protein